MQRRGLGGQLLTLVRCISSVYISASVAQVPNPAWTVVCDLENHTGNQAIANGYPEHQLVQMQS